MKLRLLLEGEYISNSSELARTLARDLKRISVENETILQRHIENIKNIIIDIGVKARPNAGTKKELVKIYSIISSVKKISKEPQTWNERYELILRIYGILRGLKKSHRTNK